MISKFTRHLIRCGVQGSVTIIRRMSEQFVLVTGGTGFLGASVIKLLQQEGYRVRTTVRDAGNRKKVEHLSQLCPQAKYPVDVVEADLSDPNSWSKAVEGCEFVHHVASPFPLVNPKSEDLIIKPAVEGTLCVLKACAAAKTVKRVVLTSSFASILSGRTLKEGMYTEADWIDTNDKTNTVYARSKGLAEKAAWKFVDELPDGDKFELAVVNPTLILGPMDNNTPGSSTAVIQRMLNREYPIVPQLCVPTVDVRDVALAHYRCMTVPEAAGHRHLISGETIWFKQMVDILHKEFYSQGYNVPTKMMPNWLLSVISVFKEELKNVLMYRTKCNLDLTRMTQVLDIKPIDFEKTIIEMAYSVIDKGFVAKTPKYKGSSGTSI